MIFLLYPVFLWGLPYLYIKFRKIKTSFAEYLKNISIAFIPVIIGLFVGLIIMEITIKVPYYKFIAQDVTGVESIRAILTRQVSVTPLPYWLEITLFAVLIASTIAGLIFSFKTVRRMACQGRIGKEKISALKTMVVIFACVFFIEVLVFLFL